MRNVWVASFAETARNLEVVQTQRALWLRQLQYVRQPLSREFVFINQATMGNVTSTSTKEFGIRGQHVSYDSEVKPSWEGVKAFQCYA